MIDYIENVFDGARIVSQNDIEHTKQSALSVVKGLAKEMLFTYETRLKITIETFDISYKVPMYINSETLLIPTSRTRDDACIWINYHAVIDTRACNQATEIVFMRGNKKVINVTKVNFDRQMEKALQIDSYMKKRM